jgi:hypothetical protein
LTTPEAILALTRARDELAEARRYVTSNVPAALDHVAFAVREIGEAPVAVDRRLKHNLRVGCEFVLVCPAVLDGYAAGAVFELGVLIARLRQASEEAA